MTLVLDIRYAQSDVRQWKFQRSSGRVWTERLSQQRCEGTRGNCRRAVVTSSRTPAVESRRVAVIRRRLRLALGEQMLKKRCGGDGCERETQHREDNEWATRQRKKRAVCKGQTVVHYGIGQIANGGHRRDERTGPALASSAKTIWDERVRHLHTQEM